MSSKLYVGNLPWTFSNDKLLETFKPHGKVLSAKVITDKETGKSRGFGFVEMENETDAMSAIKALNGSELNGRKLIVASAKTG